MTMFRQLLVPLDGSRLAETVLPAVVALAAREKSRVTLLHVVEAAAPKSIHGERHLAAGSDADAYLEEVHGWLRVRGVEADVRVEQGAGDVATAICHAAGATGTDLIALCTHGGRGVRGLLFGRVAQQVLARGHIP
ncbi:MAG TPA: universal stress protein, partial [Longimicrobiales bacterium]